MVRKRSMNILSDRPSDIEMRKPIETQQVNFLMASDVYIKKKSQAIFIYIGNMQSYSYILGDFPGSPAASEMKTQEINRFKRRGKYLK